MLLLDAALPPGTRWWVAALAALAASPGVAAIVVAWLQHRAKKEPADLAKMADRVATAEEKLAAIAGTDSKAVASVKEDLDALAQDVSRLRDAVEKRWKSDDARRGRAGELAQADREKIHEHLAALREKVATMTGTLIAMTERGHGR